MQKDWAAFRITVLLYIIVATFPLAFYFVNDAFHTYTKDTRVLRQLGYISGTMQNHALKPEADSMQQMKSAKDVFASLEPWFMQNKLEAYNVGGQPFSKSYAQISACIDGVYTQSADVRLADHCLATMNETMFAVEKAIELKNQRSLNILNINLAVIMIFIVIVINFVRIYIHMQIKKHAIIDLETNLYNKKYYDATLEKLAANSRRYAQDASEVTMKLPGLDKIADKKKKRHILKTLGGLLLSQVRMGDAVCRIEEETIAFLLPETNMEGAEILVKRVRDAIERHETLGQCKIDFRYEVSSIARSDA